MVNKTIKKVLPIILAVLLLFSAMPMQFIVSAATVSVLDGQVSVTDTADSNTVSNGTVTIKASGSLFSQKTNTVTVTNETANKVNLSFNYAASTYSSFQLNGASANASGSYSGTLEAGGTVKLTLVSNSGLSNRTATLTLSNFSISVVADSAKVTFDYDSNFGSVTVDSNAVASGTVVDVTSAGASIVATPASGAKFLGFVDGEGKILSESASYTVAPSSDMTVKAIFVGEGSAPHFSVGAITKKTYKNGLLDLISNEYSAVGKTHIFDNLNDATAYAASASAKGVVLLNDATLPAGDYTIPAGVSVLIPFDKDNTMYTDNVDARAYGSSEKFKAPTTFRKLTLASGANIIVNGVLNLSAKQIVANGGKISGGSPIDSVSMMVMEDGSSITVNNGGKLYAYGFITGKGSVTAKSGATVYECFQMMDFRGGTQASDMENKVFPISQYYIQNIEVPLTLECGSSEYSYTNVRMSNANFGSAVEFIGPKTSSMFNLTSGSVTKVYDGATDRLNIELNGEMQVRPVSLTVGTSTIDSEEYVLPINNNITITAKGGSSVNIDQDIALLPGAKIIVDEGASASLASGKSIYVYDADVWDTFVYAGKDALFSPVEYAPGRTGTRTAADLVDAEILVNGTVDVTSGYAYTTSGNANIHSDGNGVVKLQIGTPTVTYQLKQATKTYVEIPVNSAMLKNADGTYLASGNSTTTSNAFVYKDGKWICDYRYIDSSSDVTGHTYELVVTEPTCTEGGYTTHTCKACGHSYKDSETAATGHDYKSVDIKVDCEQDGYTEHTCVKCGDTYKDNIVSAKGHSYESVVTEPTCIEGGYTTHTCKNCGDSYVDTKTEAKGHSYSNFIVDTDATHSEEGSKSATCEHCGDVKTETIPVIVCDIDGDGITGKAEHLMLRKVLLGLINLNVDDAEFALFDMNDDGVVNLIDYARICRALELNGIEL